VSFKRNSLLLLMDFVLYSENRIKHINVPSGQNTNRLFNATAAVSYGATFVVPAISNVKIINFT
jgi:hypothetical protein